MKKPEFPNPRLIREDFLPEPMKNYRIKKVTDGDTTRYYPQERNMRTLWRWHYVFALDVDFDGGYDTLEEAQQKLCSYCKGTMVEYIDFDPERDCK
jgi:hypothetical protein